MHRRTDQRGVTLLLSVLMLAAITSIAFSLAVVGFAEIATSNDLVQTEPILYYSLGVAEEGTYGLKRGVSAIRGNLGSECGNFVSYTVGTAGPISSQTKICNLNQSQIELPVVQNIYNTALRLYVYDPATNNTSASGYTSVAIKKTTNNGASLQMYICPLSYDCGDPTPPSNQTGGWTSLGTPLPYDTTVFIPAPSTPSEIVILNTAGPKEFIEVTSSGALGPKGLPYLSKEAIEIQSAYGRLIRRLRVLVPAQ